jgi:hypothetical protein
MGGLENMGLPEQEFQDGRTREYGDIPMSLFWEIWDKTKKS